MFRLRKKTPVHRNLITVCYQSDNWKFMSPGGRDDFLAILAQEKPISWKKSLCLYSYMKTSLEDEVNTTSWFFVEVVIWSTQSFLKLIESVNFIVPSYFELIGIIRRSRLQFMKNSLARSYNLIVMLAEFNTDL